MKKVIKKINKKFNPAYIIDLTNVYAPEDTILAIAWAKVDGVLNKDEFQLLADDIVADAFKRCAVVTGANTLVNQIANGDSVTFSTDGIVVTRKKPNIFKRFWNWITRKK